MAFLAEWPDPLPDPTNWFNLVFNGIDLSNYKAIFIAIFLGFSPKYMANLRFTIKPI
ncbi:hypothetical protein [Pigmentiphaga sp.]|uniref:hypothetical protein n=1 Tax=Pigmentiphaga sp. TaxID=1977564 RepID=UPI0025D1456F|nr:hypothetical protein [Pigmentiphaga sp.]